LSNELIEVNNDHIDRAISALNQLKNVDPKSLPTRWGGIENGTLKFVRIIAGGGIAGAQVIDSETGRNIPDVCNISIEIPVDDIAQAHIRVLLGETDIVAEATIEGECRYCGAIKKL
jgi:hypothetical protein